MDASKPETVERLLVAPEARDRWALIKEEDYPLIMAEYTRQMRDFVEKTSNDIGTIRSWVIFYGVVTILGIMVSLLAFCTAFIP